MQVSNRIISVLCAITIAFSAISPAFAYSATDGFDPVSFWEYVYKRGFGGGSRGDGFGSGGFGGSAPDSWTTSDDMKNDYNDYVSNLPASGYDSAGKLLWQPRWSDVDGSAFKISAAGPITLLECSGSSLAISGNDYYKVSVNGGIIRVNALLQSNASCYFSKASGSYIQFKAPFTGRYTRLSSPLSVSHFERADGTFKDAQQDYVASSAAVYNTGSFIITFDNSLWSSSYPYAFGNSVRGAVEFYTPVYSVEPSEAIIINNNYTINTRVNNFQGDYYDNVTNNYYNNTTIINETTNNYYDMTTNNYYTMSNWSYDYQSRTYFVTLEDGTTITVQFGDDCLTITNNNVENSYQYVINNNNTPSPNPETPSTCKHNWTETIDVAPTCLEGGHANFTCSLCGETYEQILSAKGHNWTVKEHVNTVYGESGVIVTQGHTLYECSACGEQWYTETAAPPPDVSGGGTIISWLTNFQTWLGDMLSVGLTVNLGSIVDKLQVLIDNSTSTVENVTNVDIDETNTAFNVFYVTGEDGEKKPIGEVSGDALSASGKLLNFLYKLVFENALSKVDDSITSMSDFYFDDGAGTEGSIWD